MGLWTWFVMLQFSWTTPVINFLYLVWGGNLEPNCQPQGCDWALHLLTCSKMFSMNDIWIFTDSEIFKDREGVNAFWRSLLWKCKCNLIYLLEAETKEFVIVCHFCFKNYLDKIIKVDAANSFSPDCLIN